MLKPAISSLIKNGESRYSLVIGTAKRAREISINADEEGIALTEKSVTIAIREIYEGKIRLIEKGCCSIDNPPDNSASMTKEEIQDDHNIGSEDNYSQDDEGSQPTFID